MVKGFWSIILNIPVIIIVMVTRDVQAIITYTGGICGTFILLVIPITLVYHSRKLDVERAHGENFNKSEFQGNKYYYMLLTYALITIVCVIVGAFLWSNLIPILINIIQI